MCLMYHIFLLFNYFFLSLINILSETSYFLHFDEYAVISFPQYAYTGFEARILTSVSSDLSFLLLFLVKAIKLPSDLL